MMQIPRHSRGVVNLAVRRYLQTLVSDLLSSWKCAFRFLTEQPLLDPGDMSGFVHVLQGYALSEKQRRKIKE